MASPSLKALLYSYIVEKRFCLKCKSIVEFSDVDKIRAI